MKGVLFEFFSSKSVFNDPSSSTIRNKRVLLKKSIFFRLYSGKKLTAAVKTIIRLPFTAVKDRRYWLALAFSPCFHYRISKSVANWKSASQLQTTEYHGYIIYYTHQQIQWLLDWFLVHHSLEEGWFHTFYFHMQVDLVRNH